MNTHTSPLLILVVGRPAAGKTTIANRIASSFNLPLLAKDDFKEILFDQLGTGNRAWSMRLGQASFALLDHAIEQQLKAGSPFIIEAAYNPKYENAKFKEWQGRYGFKVIQVHCTAPTDVLVQRFVDRAKSGLRHEGHVDAESVDEFRASLGDERVETFDLDGEILEYTGEASEELLERIATGLAG